MGRTLKKGFEYFPFDTNFFQDIRIRKLIRYQSGRAVTIYVSLLCIIYNNGYYIEWDDEVPFVVAEQSNFEESYILEVIKCCIEIGLFSKQMFYAHKVLTSKGIQERYMEINKSRKRIGRIGQFSCLTEKEDESNCKKAISIMDSSELDEEINELKKSDVWLDHLQALHHITTEELKIKLDEFKLKCLTDGCTSHESINDAKKHFNNWLRFYNKNDNTRSDNKAGRRGNVLKANEKKTYSNTF